ncbi:MAG: sulfotransferase [Candidatus Sulfotelmatobacter sp.]
MSRDKAPVFVVGCPRSGTTLLYNMLLSAGGFAVYLAESNVFNLLVPRFGDLSVAANREKMVDAWLQSQLFRATFLDAGKIRAKVLTECRNGGDFLRIVMGEMGREQGVERWADNSPEELLYAVTIKKYLPGALFIHMIRDGRDVSLSLDARPHAWIRPFSWDRNDSLAIAGICWEWMLKRGRELGRQLGGDYIEVHFEELQADGPGTLAKIGAFIQHDLDYDRILRVGIGSVREPNTSFKGDGGSPVGRWKQKISAEKLALFEALVGTTLKELGYPLATAEASANRLNALRLRTFYRAYFDAKFWFKSSGLARAVRGPMSGQQIDDTTMAVDPARQAAGTRF